LISICVTKGRKGCREDARQMDLIKNRSAQMLSSIMSDCVTDESPNGSIIRSHSQGLYSQKLLSLLDVVNMAFMAAFGELGRCPQIKYSLS